MRIDEIRIDGFGCLSELVLQLDADRVLLTGPNGSGKSTLTAFLLAMLYGLGAGKAASQKRRRYRPWNGAPMGGSVRLRLDQRSYVIERRFGERPKEDSCKIWDLSTGELVQLPAGQEPGEVLLGVSAVIFQSTAFVGSRTFQPPRVADKDGERQGLLLELSQSGGADEQAVSAEQAISRLKSEAYRLLSARGDKGRIIDLKRRLDAAEDEAGRHRSSEGLLRTLDAEAAGLEERLAVTRRELEAAEASLRAAADGGRRRLEELRQRDGELRRRSEQLRAREAGLRREELDLRQRMASARQRQEAVRERQAVVREKLVTAEEARRERLLAAEQKGSGRELGRSSGLDRDLRQERDGGLGRGAVGHSWLVVAGLVLISAGFALGVFVEPIYSLVGALGLLLLLLGLFLPRQGGLPDLMEDGDEIVDEDENSDGDGVIDEDEDDWEDPIAGAFEDELANERMRGGLRGLLGDLFGDEYMDDEEDDGAGGYAVVGRGGRRGPGAQRGADGRAGSHVWRNDAGGTEDGEREQLEWDISRAVLVEAQARLARELDHLSGVLVRLSPELERVSASLGGLGGELEQLGAEREQLMLELGQLAEGQDPQLRPLEQGMDELRTRLRELAQEKAAVLGKREAVAQMASQESSRTPGLLQNEIATVRAELAAADQRRRALLAACDYIRMAVEDMQADSGPMFREALQYWLPRLTDGVLDDGMTDLALQAKVHVNEAYAPAFVDESYLSEGTAEQVGFALRLALLDHLYESGREGAGAPLPLFLDAPFSGWDDRRTQAAFDCLEEVGEGTGRQLLILTEEGRLEGLARYSALGWLVMRLRRY